MRPKKNRIIICPPKTEFHEIAATQRTIRLGPKLPYDPRKKTRVYKIHGMKIVLPRNVSPKTLAEWRELADRKLATKREINQLAAATKKTKLPPRAKLSLSLLERAETKLARYLSLSKRAFVEVMVGGHTYRLVTHSIGGNLTLAAYRVPEGLPNKKSKCERVDSNLKEYAKIIKAAAEILEFKF